ncbi:unnamed protein product [Cyprideis torosa]|uniref:Cation efflux protein transmembrane domain-containing protein n=1 Tax=Cyprideis torosa TaxID=163714 RepID=A0A7R8W837_9CRUS|nr:unnamed protein product [Cyprideis torosa]CAG0888206.1 unnamed protein product [Cyprideis torosa]
MGKFTGRKCRLICMFGLTTTFFLVEIVVGYVSNSMALVADSFHMLSDVAALVIAFVSIKVGMLGLGFGTALSEAGLLDEAQYSPGTSFHMILGNNRT